MNNCSGSEATRDFPHCGNLLIAGFQFVITNSSVMKIILSKGKNQKMAEL
jgi:hypothetical protein